MATYSVNQMKKVIKKLEKINITTEKEILNLKVLEVKKLKEQDKVSMNDIEIIWEIQDMIQDKSWFKILFDTKQQGGAKWGKLQKQENCIKKL